MEIKIITQPVPLSEIKKAADESFGDMVKAVVDIEKGVIALGGELHADAEKLLLDCGSDQSHLWGINFYPDRKRGDLIEFSSLINIRPSIGNRSVIIESEETKNKIKSIVDQLVS